MPNAFSEQKHELASPERESELYIGFEGNGGVKRKRTMGLEIR